MNKTFFTNVLICLLVVVLLTQNSEGWRRRRRRRRRRSCSPRNCQVSSWSSWNTCSASCGTGTQIRTRTVTSSASCGGSCSYQLRETRSCRGGSPRDCQVGNWSSWSSCSVICGRGTQTRNRTIKRSAVCGGSCNYNLKETRSCKGHCSCPLYRFGNRCQYRYRCGRGYRCRKHRPITFTYGQCFLRYRLTSRISVCPRTHFARLCYCHRGCHPAILWRGRGCICRCGGSGAACCASHRYVIRG